MSENNQLNGNVPPVDINCTPYVLLTRLTEEEIERATSKNGHKQSLSTASCLSSQNINIKQERPDSTDISTLNERREDQNVETIKIKKENENDQHYDAVDTSFCEPVVSRTLVENGIRLTIKPGSCKILNIKLNYKDVTEIKIESDDTPTTYNENTTFSNNHNNNLKTFCEICEKPFITVEDYVVHNYFEHKNNKPYKCELCNEQFSLEIHLNLHLIQHVHYGSRLSPLTLPTETQLSSNSNVAMNLARNNNCRSPVTSTNNSYNSNSKEKKKITKNRLIRSSNSYCQTNASEVNRNKPNLDPFKCTKCTYSTVDYNQFTSHFSICSGDTDNEPTCCRICFKTFRNQAALYGHMKYHTLRGEITSKKKRTKIICRRKPFGSYTCKYCRKKFNTNHKLHIHNLQHKNQMICKVCNQQFLFKKSFEKHLLSHKTRTLTNNKHKSRSISIIKNNLLNNQSTNKKIMKSKSVSNINTNKRQNNQIQFSCKYCKNNYKDKKTLLHHIKLIHLQSCKNLKNSYKPCDWCNAVITKSNLLRHIRTFHPKVKPIKCHLCSMKFKNNLSMRLHYSKRHPK